MQPVLDLETVYSTLTEVFGSTLHKKRALSLAQAVLGVCAAPRASVAEIGRSMAQVLGLSPKHSIKQFDRYLSNTGIEVGSLRKPYVQWVLGSRKAIVVALDWTDFDADDQSTLVLSLVTSHGRATPLAWRTVLKSSLRGRRNYIEDTLLSAVARELPEDVQVTLLADRGFGDAKLYGLLQDLGWHFVIRFRGNILVESADGVTQSASAWVPSNAKPKLLRGARVTGDGHELASVVCVHARHMKDAWCLASNLEQVTANTIIKLYARRFTIEESFRDEKDDRFGLGCSEASLSRTDRRDRLFLALAIARIFLTLLGAAGEQIGLDSRLRANTRQTKRSHSLFAQGRNYARGVAVAGALATALGHVFQQLLQSVANFSDVMCLI